MVPPLLQGAESYLCGASFQPGVGKRQRLWVSREQRAGILGGSSRGGVDAQGDRR